MKDFNGAVGDNLALVTADELSAKIRLSDVRSFSGQQLGVTIEFTLAPGWHIYGAPLPSAYTPTVVKFNDDVVASQQIVFPQPAAMGFKALNETLPVYTGTFRASGTLLLRQKLPPGKHQVSGTIEFQECNDSICKIPQTARFELPVKIDPMVPAAPHKAG
ncbi:MAG: protein-disulfide reductase DsbD domain-containing protein [Candidatus Binataceae bacterium]